MAVKKPFGGLSEGFQCQEKIFLLNDVMLKKSAYIEVKGKISKIIFGGDVND